jgi:hypothetical protein
VQFQDRRQARSPLLDGREGDGFRQVEGSDTDMLAVEAVEAVKAAEAVEVLKYPLCKGFASK